MKPRLAGLCYLLLVITPCAARAQIAGIRAASCPKCFSPPPGAIAIKDVAPNNPYIGSQVGYDFSRGSNLADNIVVSGQVVLDAINTGISRLHAPIVGNLANLRTTSSSETAEKIKDLASSGHGLAFAVAPYYEIVKSGINLTAFTSAGLKLSAAKDLQDETVYIPQGRFAGGFELVIPHTLSGNPVVLTAGPTLNIVSQNHANRVLAGRDPNIKGMDGSVILPLGSALAGMLRCTAVKGASPQYQISILLVNHTKS